MLLNRPRATTIMREAGLDALIATSRFNVAYMGDYLCDSQRVTPGVQVYGIVPADGGVPLGLVIPSLEVDAWAELPGAVSDVTAYGTVYRNRETAAPLPPDDQRIYDHTVAQETQSDALKALIVALARRGMTGAAIGLDESNLTPQGWAAIVEALPNARIVPAAALFQTIRMVKTEAEIERLARSAQITQRATGDTFAAAREGITERELADRFKASVAEQGGDPGFWLICAGRRTAHTHPRQTEYAVRRGDLIKLDVGCSYSFYWSDLGRTKALGEPGERERRIYEALCAGERAALDRVRPGVHASELFDAAVDTIRERGIPNYQRHHCGHGIGISVYDPPLIQPRGYRDIFGIGAADPALEPGMVFNLEMPYYLLGEFGFIVEDTVAVTEDGYRLLTQLDHSPSID